MHVGRGQKSTGGRVPPAPVTQGGDYGLDCLRGQVNRAASAPLINTLPSSHRHFWRAAREAAPKSAQSQISAAPGRSRGCPMPHPRHHTSHSTGLLGPGEGPAFCLKLPSQQHALPEQVPYDHCCVRALEDVRREEVLRCLDRSCLASYSWG